MKMDIIRIKDLIYTHQSLYIYIIYIKCLYKTRIIQMQTYNKNKNNPYILRNIKYNALNK